MVIVCWSLFIRQISKEQWHCPTDKGNALVLIEYPSLLLDDLELDLEAIAILTGSVLIIVILMKSSSGLEGLHVWEMIRLGSTLLRRAVQCNHYMVPYLPIPFSSTLENLLTAAVVSTRQLCRLRLLEYAIEHLRSVLCQGFGVQQSSVTC